MAGAIAFKVFFFKKIPFGNMSPSAIASLRERSFGKSFLDSFSCSFKQPTRDSEYGDSTEENLLGDFMFLSPI